MQIGEPAEMTHSTAMHDRSDFTSEPVFRPELLSLLFRNYRLMVIVPVLIGLGVFLFTKNTPRDYLSVAYLRLDADTARSALALMHSSPVAEKVLTKFPAAGETPEARRRFVDSHVTLVLVAPNLYRLGVSYRDPKDAQVMGTELVNAWLDMTRPPPDLRQTLEANLHRAEQEAKTTSDLIERLLKETTTLVSPNSLPGELATPISNLVTKRDQSLVLAQNLRNQLRGVSRDSIAVPPDLPVEPQYQASVVGLVAAILAVPLLVGLLLIGRYMGFGTKAQLARLARLWRTKDSPAQR